MTDDNPTPWCDPDHPLSPELREVVNSGARDEPAPERVAALQAAVTASIAAGITASAGTAAAASATAKAGLFKVVLGLLGAGGVAGAALVGTGVVDAPWSAPSREPASPVPSPPAPAPMADPEPLAPEIDREPETKPDAVEEAPAKRAARPRPPATAGTIAEEAQLLERARSTLESNPRAALAAAESHRRRFRRGALAQEREVLVIDALMRLGRRASAERRAAAFTRQYPHSAHRERVERLTAP